MKRYLAQSVVIAAVAFLAACAGTNQGQTTGAAEAGEKAGEKQGVKKCVPKTGSSICRDA